MVFRYFHRVTPVDALTAIPVCIGLSLLVRVAGKTVRRRRLRRRGIRAAATVIDHVVTDERRYIVAEFEYDQGRLMRIAEPCKRLTPVGEQLEVAYLPDEPDNARLPVTAAAFAGAVSVETLVGLVLLIPVLGFVGP